MNWEAAGAIGEIVGALAVVASLGFVGFQLRQNTRAIRLSSTNDLLSQFEENLARIADSEEVSGLFFRGVPNPDSLEGMDKYRFTLACQGTYFYMAKAHYQFRSGTLDPEMWDALRAQMSNFMNAPGMSSYWRNHGSNFPLEFRRFVDEEVLIGADEGWSLAGTSMPTPKVPPIE